MLEKNKPIEEMKYHYDMIRDDEDKVVDKLNLNLGFFSFRPETKSKTIEIIYDTPNDLLSTAGIILSKQIDKDGAYFKVRKISSVATSKSRQSQKYDLAKCGIKESPKDFALQVSSAINNSFANIFTIDLAEVVKKTIPKMEIVVKGKNYQIFGGTGFQGEMIFEDVLYRDIITHKKAKRKGVTVIFTNDPRYEKDRTDVLEGIERYCKELIPYKETRFEIAKRILTKRDEASKIGIKKLKTMVNEKTED